jgi:hypothetical protein
LVDSAEGRDIDGLSTDDTTRSDTGGVFTAAGGADGVHEDLEGVLAGEEVDQFHGLLDNFDSLLLFTIVPMAGGHEHACHALDNGAGRLLELALLVATSSVGDEHLLTNGLHLKVVGQRVVGGLDAFVRPLSEEFGLHGEFGLVVLFSNERIVDAF